MKASLEIYAKAVGIYALLTLPFLYIPFIYIISIGYVLIYGWLAWFLFALLYTAIVKLSLDYKIKLAILFCAVVIAVTFAFQMLEVLNVERNVWHSGQFLFFPLAAVVAGWISLYIARQKLKTREKPAQ